MIDVLYNTSDASLAEERHVVVVVHKAVENGRLKEKAYFYDSAKGDSGGGGPFDLLVDEALTRAKRFASVHNIAKVIVKESQP